jgi:DNA-binding GntR family transcriptional regulator
MDVSEQEIEALYAVRSALEEMMLCQAAERVDDAALDELRALLSDQERAAKAGSAELVSKSGEEFHRSLWRLSGNQVGIQFLEEVLQRTTRYRRLSFSEPYRFRKGLQQHIQLVAALGQGDLDGARRLIRKHVDESRNYVLQAFRTWRKAGKK